MHNREVKVTHHHKRYHKQHYKGKLMFTQLNSAVASGIDCLNGKFDQVNNKIECNVQAVARIFVGAASLAITSTGVFIACSLLMILSSAILFALALAIAVLQFVQPLVHGLMVIATMVAIPIFFILAYTRGWGIWQILTAAFSSVEEEKVKEPLLLTGSDYITPHEMTIPVITPPSVEDFIKDQLRDMYLAQTQQENEQVTPPATTGLISEEAFQNQLKSYDRIGQAFDEIAQGFEKLIKQTDSINEDFEARLASQAEEDATQDIKNDPWFASLHSDTGYIGYDWEVEVSTSCLSATTATIEKPLKEMFPAIPEKFNLLKNKTTNDLQLRIDQINEIVVDYNLAQVSKTKRLKLIELDVNRPYTRHLLATAIWEFYQNLDQ